MPFVLVVIATISLITAAVCAVVIALDLTLGHKQPEFITIYAVPAVDTSRTHRVDLMR
jgi:hypothetical protein